MVEQEEEDHLTTIFKKQKAFDETVQQDLNKLDLDQKISNKCKAIIHEAVELDRLTNWKWWKDKQYFDIDEATAELIDIMFFVVSTAIDLGMSPQDFFDMYNTKYDINVFRQNKRHELQSLSKIRGDRFQE